MPRINVMSIVLMRVKTGSLTSTNIALPTIGREFNVGPGESQWLISAYSLSNVGYPLFLFKASNDERHQGCLLVLFGRLADIWGRKLAFLLGAAWMMAFSIGCGFAPNNTSLIILRALQGFGPAAIVPAAVSAV